MILYELFEKEVCFYSNAICIMTRTLTINVPEGEVEFLTRVLTKLGIKVEESYDPEFVKKVKKAEQEVSKGQIREIHSEGELEAFLESL